jgi:hypothetical protein
VPEQDIVLQQQLPHSEVSCVVEHAGPCHAVNLAATRIAT